MSDDKKKIEGHPKSRDPIPSADFNDCSEPWAPKSVKSSKTAKLAVTGIASVAACTLWGCGDGNENEDSGSGGGSSWGR